MLGCECVGVYSSRPSPYVGMIEVMITVNICMTGRAIQGNIRFEGGSRLQGERIHNLRSEYFPILPDSKGMQQ